MSDARAELAEMPNLWIGVGLNTLAVGAEIVWALQIPEGMPFEMVPVPVWLILVNVAVWLYWLYCVKRLHDAVWAVPGYNHPITPSRAVAFHFIPFVNIWWVFQWPAKIARFVNWRTQSHSMRGWIAGVFVLLAFLLSRWIGSLGTYALYGAGFYIARQMRLAFEAPEVPESAKESMVAGTLGLG